MVFLASIICCRSSTVSDSSPFSTNARSTNACDNLTVTRLARHNSTFTRSPWSASIPRRSIQNLLQTVKSPQSVFIIVSGTLKNMGLDSWIAWIGHWLFHPRYDKSQPLIAITTRPCFSVCSLRCLLFSSQQITPECFCTLCHVRLLHHVNHVTTPHRCLELCPNTKSPCTFLFSMRPSNQTQGRLLPL